MEMEIENLTRSEAQELLLTADKVFITFSDWGKSVFGEYPYFNLWIEKDNQILPVFCEESEYSTSLKKRHKGMYEMNVWGIDKYLALIFSITVYANDVLKKVYKL